MAMTTAASVIARSQTPATTRSSIRHLPSDVWTALVVLDGISFEYVFRGRDHHDGSAPAIGRIRPNQTLGFKATRADGTVTAIDGSRIDAIRSLL